MRRDENYPTTTPNIAILTLQGVFSITPDNFDFTSGLLSESRK